MMLISNDFDKFQKYRLYRKNFFYFDFSHGGDSENGNQAFVKKKTTHELNFIEAEIFTIPVSWLYFPLE